MTLTASCHCGATRIEIAAPPDGVTACNCSFCFKRGGLWAYYAPAQVTVLAAPHAVGYGSRPELCTHYHCGVCGCSTHSDLRCSWTDEGPDFNHPRISVNARLFDDYALATALPVTEIDGRHMW